MFKDIHWQMDRGNSGVLSPGRWLWLRAMLWAIVLFGGAICFFVATLSLRRWLRLPAGTDYAFAILGPLLALGAYAFAVKTGEKRKAAEILFTRSSVYELLAGGGIGFVMIVGMLALLWLLGLYRVEPSHWKNWFDSFLFNSYISALLEELAFRAVLLRILTRVFGPLTGLILSSVLFGAAHLGHVPWLGVVEIALNGGITMGLLYLSTGRLWMSIGMHIGWDFTEWSILGVNSHDGLLLSTPVAGKTALLTGGSLGPDGSVLATVIGLVAIAGILYANSKNAFQR